MAHLLMHIYIRVYYVCMHVYTLLPPQLLPGFSAMKGKLSRRLDQGCQAGLFEAKYDKFGLQIFENLLSSWPFFQVQAYLVFGLFPKKFI